MVNQAPCGAVWHAIRNFGSHGVLMARNTNGVVKHAPLFCHSFRMLQPHAFTAAERFNLRAPDPAQITNTADKLRLYRYRKGLRQKDVAALAGLDRSTYMHYEECSREHYSLEVMERISAVLSVPVEELLDAYNLFLYCGQGTQIKALRARHNLTQRQLASQMGVPYGTLKKWEQSRVRISKESWSKLVNINSRAEA